jgi:hypothetical protein
MFSLHFTALVWAFFKSATRPRDDLMRVLRFLEGFSGVFASVLEFFLVVSLILSFHSERVTSCFSVFRDKRSLMVESFGFASWGLDGEAEGCLE